LSVVRKMVGNEWQHVSLKILGVGVRLGTREKDDLMRVIKILFQRHGTLLGLHFFSYWVNVMGYHRVIELAFSFSIRYPLAVILRSMAHDQRDKAILFDEGAFFFGWNEREIDGVASDRAFDLHRLRAAENGFPGF